jgi:hypothetical protein
MPAELLARQCLVDKFLEQFILPKRLKGAVYHRFLMTTCQYSWQICLFINDNACGSCVLFRTVRQHLSQTFGKQLTGRGAQSTGLHDPLTLTSEYLAVGTHTDSGALSADQRVENARQEIE